MKPPIDGFQKLITLMAVVTCAFFKSLSLSIISLSLLMTTITATSSISFAQNKSASHVIDLEWESIEGASEYQLELVRIDKDGDREKPIYHRTRRTLWRPKIQPGDYELRIRTFDERGVPGGWSDASRLAVVLPAPKIISPKASAKIISKERDDMNVVIDWQSVAGSKEYIVEIKSEDGSFSDDWSSSDSKLSVKLPVAKNYQVRLQARTYDDSDGEFSEWRTFSLIGAQLETPKPSKPMAEIIDKLEWSSVDDAQNYSYDILRKVKGNKWTFVKKKQLSDDNEIEFDSKNPSGVYMLRLRATAPLRKSSQQAKMIFKVKGGFRDPAAIKEAVLQESLKKPTHFYGIGSYFITQASYSGLNKEKSGQTASFNGLSGTGRIGLGYQHPKYNWGVFTIADFAGIVVDGQNSTFASVEGHGTMHLTFWGATKILFSGGLYMKELPEITGNSIDGLQSFDKITNIGAHAGFKFWRPITEKYGIMANARFYLPVTGSTPTGESIKALPSYGFGLLGSYRWTQNLLALVGYAYRIDQAGYDARSFDEIGDGFAEEGDVNQVQLKGHYLNLMLEYSF